MQKEILEAHPAAKLRVYVIWFSMLGTDSRSRWGWTGGIISDARVSHFWDEKKIVGRWYADPAERDPEIVWDTYYLYSADAEWNAKPEPLISTGATVRDEADELKRLMAPLLK